MMERKEYEFDNSLATLERMDKLIRYFHEASVEGAPKKIKDNIILALIAEFYPYVGGSNEISDDEEKKLNNFVEKLIRHDKDTSPYRVLIYLIKFGVAKQLLMRKSDDPSKALMNG